MFGITVIIWLTSTNSVSPMTLYSAEIQYAATVYNFKGNDLILECNEQFMKTISDKSWQCPNLILVKLMTTNTM